MENYSLGIDIGGTKIKSVILDEEGEIIEKNEVATEDEAGKTEIWKSKILKIIQSKYEQYSQTLTCGISAPGLVDIENRMIRFMPERLQGIENFDWSKALDRDIKVINDGHAACLAEYKRFYKTQGIQHLLMLTLGTGVGGGIIINEKLYQGNLQRAGHVGHISIEYNGVPTMTNIPGSLEHAVGNFSVKERTRGVYTSVRDLVDAYNKGNTEASKWWLESVQKLAIGLASLTNVLSPEVIVLGGGITSGAGDALIKPLKKYMATYEWRPGAYQTRIEQARLGEFAGAVGAAFFAKKSN